MYFHVLLFWHCLWAYFEVEHFAVDFPYHSLFFSVQDGLGDFDVDFLGHFFFVPMFVGV